MHEWEKRAADKEIFENKIKTLKNIIWAIVYATEESTETFEHGKIIKISNSSLEEMKRVIGE